MSYPINQKINPYSQASTGANSLQLQNIDPNTVTQEVVNNSALKGVANNNPDDSMLGGMFSPKTFLISLPLWPLMVLAVDKFNKACGGDKGILNKAGELGDKIAQRVKPLETFAEKMSQARADFMEKFVTPKHKIIYSILKTPARPENKSAVSTEAGPIGEITGNAIEKLKMHLECGGKLTLNGKDITKTELEELAQKSHAKETVEKVLEICKQQSGKTDAVMQITKGGKLPIGKEPKYLTDIWPATKKFLLRDVRFSEYTNKLEALTKGLGKSNIGKLFSNASLRGFGAVMQGFHSGAIGMLMGAYFLAEPIKKAIEAPNEKGEKRKTFIESFVNLTMFMATMSLAAKVMYHIGGLKYIGMTEKQVEEFRNSLQSLKERVKGNLISKNEHADEVKKLKTLLKGDIEKLKTDSFGTKAIKTLKNIIYKPLKLGGKLWDTGLERIPAYAGKDANILERIPKGIFNQLKRGSGFALRFMLFTTVISIGIVKVFTQLSDAIFGKPKHSVLDEDKEPEKKEQQIIAPVSQQPAQAASQVQVQPPAQVQPQQAIQPAQQNMNLAYNPEAPVQKENLIAANPADKNEIAVPKAELVRTYIPSTEGVKVDYTPGKEQKDNIDSKLKKADRAEKKANKYVEGE